jgi:hypothetical protein
MSVGVEAEFLADALVLRRYVELEGELERCLPS